MYSLSEAERLIRIPRKRIRRWMEGYAYLSRGQKRESRPVFESDIGREIGALSLTFSDMLEVRFLDAFREYGVGWREIRIAADRAKELLSRSHPFSSKVFKTDGRDILIEVARQGRVPDLLNLVKNQYEFRKVVSPLLYAGIEFNMVDEPERWWPMSRRKGIVVDSRRSFGAPIVAAVGVPTAILAASAEAEGSMRIAALVYGVPLLAVRNAVQFESALAS